jgi:hypothetical protein
MYRTDTICRRRARHSRDRHQAWTYVMSVFISIGIPQEPGAMVIVPPPSKGACMRGLMHAWRWTKHLRRKLPPLVSPNIARVPAVRVAGVVGISHLPVTLIMICTYNTFTQIVYICIYQMCKYMIRPRWLSRRAYNLSAQTLVIEERTKGGGDEFKMKKGIHGS